jgi:hypothetical protein
MTGLVHCPQQRLTRLHELLHPTPQYRAKLAAWIIERERISGRSLKLTARKLLERHVYFDDRGLVVVEDGWGTVLKEWRPRPAERRALRAYAERA